MKSQKLSYKEYILVLFQMHMGHTVRFQWNSEMCSGKLLRVTWSDSVADAVLWLESKPFPVQIFGQEAVECSCGEGKQ